MIALKGSGADALNTYILEHFNPGETITVVASIPRELDAFELQEIRDDFADSGIALKKLQMGDTREWPHALKMVMVRPSIQGGTGAIPLLFAIPGILGALGIAGWFAFKGGEALDDLVAALTKYFFPIALGTMGTIILIAYVLKPTPEHISAYRGK